MTMHEPRGYRKRDTAFTLGCLLIFVNQSPFLSFVSIVTSIPCCFINLYYPSGATLPLILLEEVTNVIILLFIYENVHLFTRGSKITLPSPASSLESRRLVPQ